MKITENERRHILEMHGSVDNQIVINEQFYKSEQLRNLQIALNKAGQNVATDGILGPKTLAAVGKVLDINIQAPSTAASAQQGQRVAVTNQQPAQEPIYAGELSPVTVNAQGAQNAPVQNTTAPTPNPVNVDQSFEIDKVNEKDKKLKYPIETKDWFN